MNKSAAFVLTSLLSSVMANPALAAPSVIELQTNLGTIAIKLDYDNAPITANNFVNYVNKGFYKNTLFHRLVKDFVIQGGGFDKTSGEQKATLAPIKNEANNGLSNRKGTIAMARTSDPDSATSQFFINLKDNSSVLDYKSATNPGYAVFGQVVKGMSVVEKIGNLGTYNELPFTSNSSLVFIDAVYKNDTWQTSQSTTRINIEGQGTVVSAPVGINCGSNCSLTLANRMVITLTATPASGFSFTGWRGDCQGFSTKIALNTTHGNHNCTAAFTKLSAYTQ